MEPSLKKRQIVNLPPLYKDIWTLICEHLEWPELYAMAMVAKIVRRAALPILKQHATKLLEKICGQIYIGRLNTAPNYFWYRHGGVIVRFTIPFAPDDAKWQHVFELVRTLVTAHQRAHGNILPSHIAQTFDEETARFYAICDKT